MPGDLRRSKTSLQRRPWKRGVTLDRKRKREPGYLVSHSVDVGPGVKDGQFGELAIGFPYDFQVPFVVFVSFATHAHKGLAGACDDSLGLRMDPGQHLREQ